MHLALNKPQPPGTLTAHSVPVPPHARAAVVAVAMEDRDAKNASLALRLGVEACFDGVNWSPMRWMDWQGNAGGSRPLLRWDFDPNHPPQRVRVVLDLPQPLAAGMALDFF